MNDSRWYNHENGYSAVLYGESSMRVYYDDKIVLHTANRAANTENEIMELLGEMPNLIKNNI